MYVVVVFEAWAGRMKNLVVEGGVVVCVGGASWSFGADLLGGVCRREVLAITELSGMAVGWPLHLLFVAVEGKRVRCWVAARLLPRLRASCDVPWVL